MRIAVVTSSPPFVEGGHLVIARELVRACREQGHAADLVVTPQNRFGRQGAAYLSAWLHRRRPGGRRRRRRPGDQPALSRPSPSATPATRCGSTTPCASTTICWPTFSAAISWRNRIKESARRSLIHAADRHFLDRRVSRRFAISATVQARMAAAGIPFEVLHPPAPARPYRCDGYDDYVFAVSRLTPLKRFDLLLDALAHPTARGIRAVIAGEGEERDRLIEQRRRLGLDDRVELVGRLDDAQVARSPGALPGRGLRAARRGLRLRHGRGVCGRTSRSSPAATAAGRPSWSPTASTAWWPRPTRRRWPRRCGG